VLVNPKGTETFIPFELILGVFVNAKWAR